MQGASLLASKVSRETDLFTEHSNAFAHAEHVRDWSQLLACVLCGRLMLRL